MSQTLRVTAGQVIFTRGSFDSNAYILRKGRVELTMSDGRSEEVQAVSAIGEHAWLQQPKLYDATALEECELQQLSREEVLQLAGKSSLEVQWVMQALLQGLAVAHAPHAPASAATDTAVTGALKDVVAALSRLQQGDSPSENAGHAAFALPANQQLQSDELGPIAPFHADESVNDILINGTHSVFVERHGKLEDTGFRFHSDEEVLKLAETIARKVGRRLDPHRPMVDARLMDGSRVNVIAPPLAVDGPTISIRKFSRLGISLDRMVEQQNISAQIAEFMKIIGFARMNVLISGGTGSGKTTMLNAIAEHIDASERIVTVEDAAELQLHQPHVVRLETKPISTRGGQEDEVNMRDLVKNALRMRPDRIVVGEVRGGEAYDMMQAMNTGHEGSMSTIHANHPRDALSRLENMIGLNNPNFPMRAVRAQIASALHVIIQVSRMRDGHRRVVYVTEICGIEGDVITLQDLFSFNVTGETKQGKLDGNFNWTGIMPRSLRRIAYYGMYDRLGKLLGVKLPKL